ncbi:MAG TPA: T9SS type A sorting domain-containing protein [Chitinophagaceae bacterium]|jgi:hypothetical protein|nr:T9SS type A sorting domain-containing protein [Chitinophagaceae bacterium]
MKEYIIRSVLAIALLTPGCVVFAQAPGSVETIGGTPGLVVYSTATGNTTSSVSETLYMGPGIYQIDGTWEVYSKNVWISPDVVIAGTGVIRFFNPSVAGGIASPTLTDGNNNAAFLNVNLDLQNAANMVLTDMAGPGAPFTDLVGNANVTVGLDFNFGIANGDVLLVNHDLVTATTATLSNYLPTQFVVTNGTGHLVHNNYTGAFVYPVGIGEGDYTPAAVNTAISNTIHVLVQNYANSSSFEAGDDGINRTWNIYADNAAANAVIDLQHNLVTNLAGFDNSICFITQYGPVVPNTTGQTTLSQTAWQSNNPGAGTVTGSLTTGPVIPGASERNLAYSTLATTAGDPAAFFTKSSNELIPLPVRLTSFSGRAVNCAVILKWETGEEQGVRNFELQSSTDGINFINAVQITSKGNNSSYSYTIDNSIPAVCFYRLRIIDLDGHESYSKIIPVQSGCKDPFVIKVYPNPVKDVLTISGIIPQSQLQLTDAAGRIISREVATGTAQEIDMSKLPSGIYMLQVIQDGRSIKNIKLARE